MSEQLAISLVQHLAWPLVALIAFLMLKGELVRLATGASDLKKILDDPGDLIKILDRIAKASETTREAVDDLTIKSESKDAANAPPVAAALTPDQMFDTIKGTWGTIVDEIRRRAETVGIKTQLVGYKGVNATLDELVKTGALSAPAAEAVKDVSTRWQPMMRNQPRKSEWLTQQVFTSFMAASDKAKSALAG